MLGDLTVSILYRGLFLVSIVFAILAGRLWLAALAALYIPYVVVDYLYNEDRRRRVLGVERGRFICMRCNYDLTGNESGRCPECGLLTMVEPKQ